MAGIGVIVLAAGRSTRFAAGLTSKLLASVNGVALVRLAVIAAADAGVGDVTVVTGDRAADVSVALAGLPIRLVYEPAFAEGMAISLGCGVRELRAMDAVIVALGDQPGVRPEAYQRVASRWRTTGAPIVIPRYAGSSVPSHPTLFASSVFGELLALRGDVGARGVIASNASVVVEEPLEWAAPRDVDTVDDLHDCLDRGAPAPADVADRPPSLASPDTDTLR